MRIGLCLRYLRIQGKWEEWAAEVKEAYAFFLWEADAGLSSSFSKKKKVGAGKELGVKNVRVKKVLFCLKRGSPSRKRKEKKNNRSILVYLANKRIYVFYVKFSLFIPPFQFYKDLSSSHGWTIGRRSRRRWDIIGFRIVLPFLHLLRWLYWRWRWRWLCQCCWRWVARIG